MTENIENLMQNVQNEILFVGSFYKRPDLYVEYGRYIKSKYDLSDEVTKFLYDMFELYYKTFSQTIDEIKINTFMSQDKERLKLYKKYGGYKIIKTWMELSDDEDFKNYMEIVKKYSLLREFHRKGYNVEKIINHPKFNILKANDIYRIIRSGADKIGTIILSNEDSIIINENTQSTVKSWLLKPQMGMEIPFKTLNEMFRGMRLGKMFALGFLSNEGKSRLAILMAAYISLIKGEKTLVLANETSEEDLRACLLTSVINNEYFKQLHGIEIEKPEKEIVLGIYRDDNGNIIERYTNENGEFIESEEDYADRTYNTSTEYRKVMQVGQWIEEQTKNKIFFKALKDYSDDAIEFEIRKHQLVHGVKYIFYDTLKSYKDEQWSVLKQTTTMLSSLALEIGVFIWASIQLTDDSVYTDVFSFSSNNIANAKQLKHILDYLCLGKRIHKDEYHKYKYMSISDAWGEPVETSLDLSKTYYALKVDKNRSGSKDRIPLLEVDLDHNTWIERGVLIKNE